MPQRFACSMPYGIRGWCSNRLASIGPNAGACSTPYGIRGWCSPPVLPRSVKSQKSCTPILSKLFMSLSFFGTVAIRRCLNPVRRPGVSTK